MPKVKTPPHLLKRLQRLERKVKVLKKDLISKIKGEEPQRSKSLRGLLKGIKIEKEDIERAKRSFRQKASN